MQTISLIFLALLAFMCAVGALHPRFEDNTFQRIGMGCVCLSSVALFDHVYRQGGASPAYTLMAGGLLVYALGVVIKVSKRPKTLVFPKIEG